MNTIHEVTAKGKVVGNFGEDGVYRKWVHGRQIFRMTGNSIGIMEDVIEKLKAEPSWVGVEVEVIDGPYKGKYKSSKVAWLARDIRTGNYGGWGLQRFLPLKRMEKIA